MAAAGDSDARQRNESGELLGDEDGEICLLLWGKTGRGKSATGNTILGRNEFESKPGEDSTTKSSDVGWTKIDGRIVKVVDTPGIFDTEIIGEKQIQEVAQENIKDAFNHCATGFSAVVLLLKFNEKMTSEERGAIAYLKEILGEDVLKTHGICVISHGDVFQIEYEGEKSFQDWCREKSGYTGDLFEECNYRCVLMNNKCKEPGDKNRQVLELLAQVDALESRGQPYEHDLFTQLMEQRRREQAENGGITEIMVRDTNLVLETLNFIKICEDVTNALTGLKTARAKVAKICDALNAKDGKNINKAIEGLVDVSSRLYHMIPKQTTDFRIDENFHQGLEEVIKLLTKMYNTIMKPALRSKWRKAWDFVREHGAHIISAALLIISVILKQK